MATAAPRRRLLRRPAVIVALAVLVVAAGVGLYLFQPWKLFVDQTVAEAAPVVAAAPAAADAPAAPAEPAVLATGELITHEHATTGTVQLLQLPDGSKVLRVQDLDTSNGPLLKVWLTDQPVIEGSDGWHVFDDGRHLDLGDLKGNLGSANYPIPADADLTGLSSVSIWCDRFNVSFGAAELRT